MNSEESASSMRNRLFNEAASAKNWSLAFEVAMVGGPEAEGMDGDPERLVLLERIPPDELDNALRFRLALALARHLMYAGREVEAQGWANTTRDLASTPNDQLLSRITRTLVGDIEDQRAVIPLPDVFDTMAPASVNMRSMQVAVMTHHECGSFDEAYAVQQRYEKLVESRAEPYRRWHLLTLQSMNEFVSGRLTAAVGAARAAFEYGSLFRIADAETALIGQLANARLIDANQPRAHDYQGLISSTAPSLLVRTLHAASEARRTGGDTVDEFLRTFDYHSRMIVTHGVINTVAPYVRSPNVRAELAERLRERTGTSAIWATGFLHMGPVDRTLARVVADSSEIPDLLANAIAVADRQNTRIWRVVCRLDLAVATRNASLRREAEELAITPELQDMLTSYEPWPIAVR